MMSSIAFRFVVPWWVNPAIATSGFFARVLSAVGVRPSIEASERIVNALGNLLGRTVRVESVVMK